MLSSSLRVEEVERRGRRRSRSRNAPAAAASFEDHRDFQVGSSEWAASLRLCEPDQTTSNGSARPPEPVDLGVD